MPNNADSNVNLLISKAQKEWQEILEELVKAEIARDAALAERRCGIHEQERVVRLETMLRVHQKELAWLYRLRLGGTHTTVLSSREDFVKEVLLPTSDAAPIASPPAASQSARPTSAHSRPGDGAAPVDLPSFPICNGKPIPISQFIQLFEKSLQSNGLDIDKNWYQLIPRCLNTEAKKWFEKHSESGMPWKSFKYRISQRYSKTRITVRAKQILTSIQMRSGEPINAFADRLASVAADADSQTLTDKNIVCRLLRILPNNVRLSLESQFRQGATESSVNSIIKFLRAPKPQVPDSIDAARDGKNVKHHPQSDTAIDAFDSNKPSKRQRSSEDIGDGSGWPGSPQPTTPRQNGQSKVEDVQGWGFINSERLAMLGPLKNRDKSHVLSSPKSDINENKNISNRVGPPNLQHNVPWVQW